MKSFFDTFLLLFVTLTMFVCMMFFAEEITVQQKGIHLRNRVVEIIEINNGYTSIAENEIKSLFSKYNKDITLNVSKEGTLSQGEKMFFEIIIIHTRTLPFNTSDVEYKIIGEYYNING